MGIHPTAVVDAKAELDPTVEVGPYAIIEAGVRIDAGTRIFPHAFIATGTTLGQRCQVHPFAVVGHWPQDFAFKGQPSYTTIGDETVIREHASVHRGTMPESTTAIGQRCFLMSTAHVGHNCALGNDVKIANSGLLSGHVTVGNGAFISGNSSTHQFVRIGELAMIAGGIRVTTDVAPYMTCGPTGLVGPNVVGLRRASFTSDERAELRACYHVLFRSGKHFPVALAEAEDMVRTDPGRRLLEFLRTPSKRGLARYRTQARRRGREIEV